MKPARLKLYYSYLGNFDFIDKRLRISNPLIDMPELTTLNIKSKLNSNQLDKNIVIRGLVLEVFGNQRFLARKMEKVIFKNLLLELTLRKENLFLFLDTCLNTVFLYKHKFLTLGNIKLENKLHFYLNNDLINHFVLVSNKFKYFIHISNLNNLEKNLNSWFFI